MASQSDFTPKEIEILELALRRRLDREDLSFSEALVILYGARPKKIGARRVKKLPLPDLIEICRLDPHEEFYFSDEKEKEKFRLNLFCLTQTVSRLVEEGYLARVVSEKLIWARAGDKPQVERIEFREMVRLTESGKKFLGRKKSSSPNLLVSLLFSLAPFTEDCAAALSGII